MTNLTGKMSAKQQTALANKMIAVFVVLVCVTFSFQLIVAVITGLCVASLIIISLIFVSVVIEAINNPVYTQD